MPHPGHLAEFVATQVDGTGAILNLGDEAEGLRVLQPRLVRVNQRSLLNFPALATIFFLPDREGTSSPVAYPSVLSSSTMRTMPRSDRSLPVGHATTSKHTLKTLPHATHCVLEVWAARVSFSKFPPASKPSKSYSASHSFMNDHHDMELPRRKFCDEKYARRSLVIGGLLWVRMGPAVPRACAPEVAHLCVTTSGIIQKPSPQREDASIEFPRITWKAAHVRRLIFGEAGSAPEVNEEYAVIEELD